MGIVPGRGRGGIFLVLKPWFMCSLLWTTTMRRWYLINLITPKISRFLLYALEVFLVDLKCRQFFIGPRVSIMRGGGGVPIEYFWSGSQYLFVTIHAHTFGAHIHNFLQLNQFICLFRCLVYQWGLFNPGKCESHSGATARQPPSCSCSPAPFPPGNSTTVGWLQESVEEEEGETEGRRGFEGQSGRQAPSSPATWPRTQCRCEGKGHQSGSSSIWSVWQIFVFIECSFLAALAALYLPLLSQSLPL